MNTELFTKYSQAIRQFDGMTQARSLHMADEGRLSVFYAPTDWVNVEAKVIIVGITPGPTQAFNLLSEAKRHLLAGADAETALMHAKKIGGFSGALRANLVAMLDRVGFHRWAQISSSAELFRTQSHLVQTASVLPYPVFADGKPYAGKQSLLRSPLLRSMTMEHFVPMAQAIPEARLLAVGDVPFKTLTWLAEQGALDPKRIVGQLPHPSTQSGERIKYFLGHTPAAKLSTKTNAAKLDCMRIHLEQALISCSRPA